MDLNNGDCESIRGWKRPLELFECGRVKICAPMVRYSKLAFRSLVRRYGCDLAFTPMIVADSFLQSQRARDSEFTTNSGDRPLIVQFAARNASEFANATELIAQYADGVDLNCGCPQRWAMSEGYGANLLDHPEIVTDMVKQTRNRISDSDFTVSVKIRIKDNIQETVELCRRAEMAGLNFITVHGRTKHQRNEPVDKYAIRTVRESVGIPVVANGDAKTLDDCHKLWEQCGTAGVMVARGLLENPAMFTGAEYTTVDCLNDWVFTAMSIGTSFSTLHRHLVSMCENIIPKPERRVFNALTSTSAVLDYMSKYLNVPMKPI